MGRLREAPGRLREALHPRGTPPPPPPLPSLPPPHPTRWAWIADVVLALILAVSTVGAALDAAQDGPGVPRFGPFQVAEPGVTAPDPPAPPEIPPAPPPGHAPDERAHTSALLLAALTALPLAVRRRYPLAAFWAVLALTLLYRLRHGEGSAATDVTGVHTFLSCVVGAYSAAAHSPHRRRALGGILAGAVLMAVLRDQFFPYLTPGYVPFLVLVAVGLGANALHIWQQRVRALQARQDSATRRAVERERARIARELHDVVTHNVSVMVIQAGAARKVMDTAPDRAREALLAVEAGGRTAMTELRHVMGLLTMSEEPAGPGDLAPQPGLDRLEALTDRVRAAGTPVGLTVTGTPAALSPGADLAAYRVVQEALTNVVKHAAGARVRVTVAHTPAEVRIEVADSGGTSAAPAGAGEGRGLLGLRERLAVHGGTLTAAPAPAGGFRVLATIPVDAP
ncbi:histidine kinase [Streptomyces sp. NPDC093252]|uniref:sensor histidine kinase n=1 Tax=Streptomyces sp. NPDC093252 TaxID=3154980 RepID=UPI0034495661